MPCIEMKTNVTITPEKEISLKEKFGQAVQIIGKSEGWLMVTFLDNCRMYFGGFDQPAAFIEVKLFGKSNEIAFRKMTGELMKIVNTELDIPTKQIYIKYEEINHWGWDGDNF